jgi:lipopolysaccharide transport system ATP-binding protein
MSSSDVAISIRGLGKAYTIVHEPQQSTLAETVLHRLRRPFRRPSRETFWALDDVSFDVARGDVMAVIGRNGAGKTTLLKILSQITEPTRGSVHLRGRVGSLLEVGTGFHPELTGRENIYLNGSILGMRRADIRRQFDAIVDFAGVERFLDTPVKRYSSGMAVRLAFAVAAHLDPEILLVDEVLAVGDAAFQRKCLGKMHDVSTREGRTVVFVSHNLGAVSTLCRHAVLLSQGAVQAQGRVEDVLRIYTADLNVLAGARDLLAGGTRRRGDGSARFVRAELMDPGGGFLSCATEGEPFRIRLVVRVERRIELDILSITLVDGFGNDLATTMHYDSMTCQTLDPGVHVFSADFTPNLLRRGTYGVRLACFGPTFHEYDHVFDAFALVVAPAADDPDAVLPRPGTVDLPVRWHVAKPEAVDAR